MAPLGEIRVGGPGRAALPASLSCGSAKPQRKGAIVGVTRDGDSSPPQRRFLLAQPPSETLRGTTGLAGARAVGRRRGWLHGPLHPSGHRPGRWALGGLSSSRAKAVHWFPGTALTKCHPQGGLMRRTAWSPALAAGSPRSRCEQDPGLPVASCCRPSCPSVMG